MTLEDCFNILWLPCAVYVYLLSPLGYHAKQYLKKKGLRSWIYNLPYCDKCWTFWSSLIIFNELEIAVIQVVLTKLLLKYV